MERQYALVRGNELMVDKDGLPVTTGYLTEKPEDYSSFYPEDCVWLPVESVDSQQFDPFGKTHFRGAPVFEVDADRVRRVYPIIPVRR